MDPVSLAAIGTAVASAATSTTAATIGAGVSAAGSIFGGIAASGQASYQSQVAKNNATVAEQNARYASAAASTNAQAAGMRSAQRQGQIRAAQGANGIDVNSGSNVEVQKSQAELGELDELSAENKGLLQAYGYKSQATSFDAESRLQDSIATTAPIAGALKAGGTLLGSASALGTKWNSGTSWQSDLTDSDIAKMTT